MQISEFFQEAVRLLENQKYERLPTLSLDKPEYFNWVEEAFYPINVAQHPDSQALIWRDEHQTRNFTFQDVYHQANQLINFLRKHGHQHGDHIYTILPLVPENWISFLAVIKGGYIVMPTATNLSTDDLAYRFETLLPEVMIADHENAEKVDEAEARHGQKVSLKIITSGKRPGWHSIDEIALESTEAAPAPTKADDPLLYFFTSGTTGMPKVVVHTHFTYPVGHLTTASWLGCRHGDVHYNISSPGWAKFAWSSFFAPWTMGATIFANKTTGFDAKAQLQAMAEYGVTTFCGSPTVIRMLVQEDISQYALKLRSCCAAGEPLNPEVIMQWQHGTGTVIRDGYGQTETTALICNLQGQALKPGSMGKPTFLYDIGIYDNEGNPMDPHEEGVICIKAGAGRHNGLFSAYLNDPERTAMAFKHGLYYTGDKAYMDEDGYIWFVGRNDDVIKASAYRIGPFEVESVLIAHEDIVESAVVASPHPVRGNAVKAFVMLREGVTPSAHLAEDIFSFAAEKLSSYKIPRIIEFPSTLPKTISGKIRRVELRKQEAQDREKKVDKPNEYFHNKY